MKLCPKHDALAIHGPRHSGNPSPVIRQSPRRAWGPASVRDIDQEEIVNSFIEGPPEENLIPLGRKHGKHVAWDISGRGGQKRARAVLYVEDRDATHALWRLAV